MNTFPDRLLAGYSRFMTGRYGEESDRYRELADKGQKPKTLIVACCDSRSAPETIFNAGPGELFVVRNVANLVPPYAPDGSFHSTSAALEFAVQSLRVRDIVVMGHGRCGGISAALNPGATPLSPGDFIGQWISLLDPVKSEIRSGAIEDGPERQTALERISIRNSITNLRTFPCVRILEGRGKLDLHGAWFDISTGELWVMDAASGQFTRPGEKQLERSLIRSAHEDAV